MTSCHRGPELARLLDSRSRRRRWRERFELTVPIGLALALGVGLLLVRGCGPAPLSGEMDSLDGARR